jgi:NDP-sugar pyrophosphorylase family protein
VHREAFVARDASLIGPVLVGPGVRVMSGAVVVGPSSIGREATIDKGAFVSRCAVWRRSVIGEHATADRCILADDAVVGGATQHFGGIIPGGRCGLESQERPVSRPSLLPKVFEFGTGLGRFVFGASWSRSPATQ